MNTKTIRRLEVHHSRVADWAESLEAPLVAMVSTAAALAGLADVTWRALIGPGISGLDVLVSGAIGTAYDPASARAEVTRYARTWGDGVVVESVEAGRVIVSALVSVEDYLPVRVWCDAGPARDARNFAVVRAHYERQAAEAVAAVTP